jgi:hypothetical protein
MDAESDAQRARHGIVSGRRARRDGMPQHAYPRPQLERPDWTSLDGEWDFALDREARWQGPREVHWDRTIRVPFAPETAASGIHDTSFYSACWYRKRIEVAPVPGTRLLLHFGAVDSAATVWADGIPVARHEGGYTPFTADLTPIASGEPIELVVRAFDDPHDLAKPRGKQDWRLEPHSIWYPRTTGIWQTVWLERVPEPWITELRWSASLERWEIGIHAWIAPCMAEHLRLRVRLEVGDTALADDSYSVSAGEVSRRMALSDPGIDDYRNERLWSPDTPTLIDAHVELVRDDGRVVDRVRSYTALRSVGVQGNRIVLNGRPLPLRLVLDQGYWPDTGLTAPDDAAIVKDVELVRAMGFNGVRKHQKIEDPRYLYWADRLGLVVWEEMPSAYRFTRRAIERITREWTEAVLRDTSHPCIIAWVPFNESWGVPNLPDIPAERHFVSALYHLTKTLDATRPVIGNDGWEAVATDVIGVHDYDADPERLCARYSTPDVLSQMFEQVRPSGRQIALEPHRGQPIVLSECGGIALAPDSDKTWGYTRVETAEELAAGYGGLVRALRSLQLFAGFCYTQLTDTYQEANGLCTMDRRPKIPIETIAEATRGPQSERMRREMDLKWRMRLMRFRRENELPIDE